MLCLSFCFFPFENENKRKKIRRQKNPTKKKKKIIAFCYKPKEKVSKKKNNSHMANWQKCKFNMLKNPPPPMCVVIWQQLVFTFLSIPSSFWPSAVACWSLGFCLRASSMVFFFGIFAAWHQLNFLLTSAKITAASSTVSLCLLCPLYVWSLRAPITLFAYPLMLHTAQPNNLKFICLFVWASSYRITNFGEPINVLSVG